MIEKNKARWQLVSRFAPLLTLILVIIIWEGAIKLFNIPRTSFPSLFAVIATLVKNFGEVFGPHLWYTFKTVLLGMAIGIPCGVVTGSIVSQLKAVERVLYPYVVAIVTIPMVALLPILMFWTGFGMTARVIVVICQVVPIVTLQSLTGFSSVEKKKVNLGLSVGASKLTRFVKIVFPNALPYVFTGMRLGSIFATTATISAELISSSEGLGNRVIYFSKLVATESTFACIILIAAIGVTWFMLLTYIEKKIVIWKH